MKKHDTSNPAYVAFLINSIENESTRRIAWIQKNPDLFYKAAHLNREPKNYTENDITESLAVAGMAATTRDHISGARHKFVLPEKDFQKEKKDGIKKDLKEQTNMTPITSTDRELLVENRKKYLKERAKLAPEEKFKFTESENWMYGWQMSQSNLTLRGPAYGKKGGLKDATVSKVGPQRDPDHYEMHEIQFYDKCAEMAWGMDKN